MRDIEITFVLDPSRKKVLVGNEVADVALNVINNLLIIFREGADFLFARAFFLRETHQFVGEIFVEDEAEDVVFVFVGLDLGAHLIGRFPDFGSELLFVHGKMI